MADNLTDAGTELFNTEEKLFEDIQAEPGADRRTRSCTRCPTRAPSAS